MIGNDERIVRDAMRKAERIEVIWWNGEAVGSLASMDPEFAKEVAMAYVRLCERQEKRI